MKRTLWISILGGVTVVAGGLAFGLNLVLASKVRPPDGAELVDVSGADGGDAVADAGGDEAEAPRHGKGARRSPTRAPSMDAFMRPIMDRSLFDSSKVGSTGDALGGGVEGEEQEATDLGATLLLTMVAVDPQFSTALIKTDQPYGDVYAIGDALADATVEEIVRRRVYVRRSNGAREYLEIGGKTDKKKASPEDRSNKRKRKGRIDWSEGVTKIDDTHYRVDRESIDTALANLDRLSRDARVVPNFVDGKSNGFKVFGIKRNSAYKHLGLKNNDVITGVNGMEITSPDKALDMYSKLQTESSISLEIIRKGEPMTMEYDIQ